jgi:hypothetical protein
MAFVDQFNDPAYGVMVRQLTRMPGLEEFVKEASLDDMARDSDKLPDRCFAWPEERRYPIHTEKHAALSYGYILAEASVPEYVKKAAKEALDVFNVPESIFAVSTEKVASEQFLLPEDRLFPVNTPTQVKTAQSVFIENLSKLNVERRVEAAVNLVKVASETGVVVNPIVQKTAGLTVCDTRQARSWISARVEAAKEPVYKLAYQALSDGLATQPRESADRNGLIKMAQVLGDLDEKAGLVKFYDRKLPDPLQTLFNTEKTAAACVDLCGKLVPVTKLAALPASFWADLGGQELADEICPGGACDSSKLAAVVDTLPLDLKTVLKSQVA